MTSTPAATHVPKVYSLEQIEQVTNKPGFALELIAAIQQGFVDLEEGKFFACPIQTMGLPPFEFGTVAPPSNKETYSAQTCVKSGYFKGGLYYVIKVASGGHPMPSNSGNMQVYSQTTGTLQALLLDNGILTELRTAAVGALAAKLLAPSTIHKIGLLGTGVQARYQLTMLETVTTCRTVVLWGRSKPNVLALQQELQGRGWTVEMVEEPDDVWQECNLIVTTTGARQAVLGVSNNKCIPKNKGIHITCIGADAPGKQELDTRVIQQAVGAGCLLVADTIGQTQERGEFQHAIKEGLVSPQDIVSLGSLVTRTDLHRRASSPGEEEDHRLTIFDSSGVALQDCIVAQMTYEALQKQET
jgi:ornithine cyclodeaminase